MKKRFFLVLALTAVLLLAVSMSTALAATADDGHAHWAYCNNPTVCAECNEAYSGDDIRHFYNPNDYASDTEYHWHACTVCGAQVDKERHEANCRAPKVCTVCEQSECENPTLVHSWFGKAPIEKIDETYHAELCPNCNQILKAEKHTVYCISSGKCEVCGEECPEVAVEHNYVAGVYQKDENNHWNVCQYCGEAVNKEEHSAYCTKRDVCNVCKSAYYGSNIIHGSLTLKSDSTNHWYECSNCDEQVSLAAHSFDENQKCTVCGYQGPKPTEAPTTAPTEKPIEAPTAVPTEAPTAVPTEKPTEAPTAVPTEKPTEVPKEVPTEVPTVVPTEAPTAVPTEKPTEAPTAAPTAAPTKAPHEHVFRTFVYRFDGMHWSQCEVCGYGVTRRCAPESRTVNGVPCEVCGICGHTTVPELTGIELPEEPVADASAVTAEGTAASVLVYDLTPALPGDSVFALCLQVVPQDGAAMPGSVQITLPCAVDMANLRLIFIADGEAPVDVPYSVGGGMITFTVNAAGIFALVPVQE